MYVCICHAVTDRQVREVLVTQSVATVAELQLHLPVGACCGRCLPTAEEVIEAHRSTRADSATPQADSATPQPARAA